MEMRRLIFIITAILSGIASASELHFSNQLIKINRQNETGYQAYVSGKTALNSAWELGLLANYIERFRLYETRLGGLATYRPNDRFFFEMRYLKGQENVQLLPKDQYGITVYHSWSDGISPFLNYQNSIYSITSLQTLKLGVEIEKIKNIIIIPHASIGQAKFNDPSETKEVNHLGLKVMYVVEENYSFQVYASKGIEASQAIVGRDSQTIETKTAGFGASYYTFGQLKLEGLFDYTDLGQLKNQFLTTTINLSWNF
jgi:hypothetical protein